MPISLTNSDPYTQDFDSLAGSGTTNTLNIPGWALAETGTSATVNQQYAGGNGSATAGDTYSFGTTGSTDRALGTLLSGTISSVIGANFTNDTGGVIDSLAISYTGEEWRLGSASRADRLDFQISFNATGVNDSSATWTDVDSLDFSTPDFAATAGARDGNSAAEHTAISGTVATNIAAGAGFWIRWTDYNASGSDDGLAIDNFSLSAHTAAAPPPAGTFSIANGSASEAAGFVDLTVTRVGGSAGEATINYAVTPGTATADDFASGTLPSGTIHFADGQTSQVVHVAVNNDTTYEPDETFTVTLSNPTAGTLGTASATGTILNDDPAPTVNHGTLSVDAASTAEGNSGAHDIVFTVHRDGGSDGAVSAAWTATLPGGSGGADASDFAPGQATNGTVNFADGATTAEIHLSVQGDTTFEPNESFTVALSAPTGGAALGSSASATGTITNDDTAPVANVFINEIHYDNSGVDSHEGIEIAGPAGTDLSGYTLVLYNGHDGTTYGSPRALSGVIGNQDDGFGTVAFAYPSNGIQNGGSTTPESDGVALIGPGGQVIQFLSYEGTMTAVNGPAAGLTSTDIGVAEDGSKAATLSLQLTGAGSNPGDFTWQPDDTASFGAVNAGQDFLSPTGPSLITAADVHVTEGNSGTTDMVFHVNRAGGSDHATTVDYQIVLPGGANGADASDVAADQVLSGTLTFAAGVTRQDVVVHVNGDTVGENNETLQLRLSNPGGDTSLGNAVATGTIVNDDPLDRAIYDIQGASHTSAYVGQQVTTSGIVTQVGTNGYYLQDANGDGNIATSDAIYVFTHGAPGVAVGDAVQATGTVAEYSADPGVGLTTTELDNSTATVLSHNNALPAAVLIGDDGRTPPSMVIDDDHLTSFDPTHDGADFYESLEGMLVTVENPLVIQSTNSYGETYVVASNGGGATGVAARGGLTLSAGDANPERIQIDTPTGSAGFTEGDHITSVTGVVSYSFDEYKVLTTAAPAVTTPTTLARETTTLTGDADHLSVATYNCENLDASDDKYGTLANDIIHNMGGPDIVSLQEIQDDNGTGTGVLTAQQNLTNLVNALNAADPTAHYAFAEIDPTAENSTGGEPNGNIRNAFVYDTNRVTLVPGSLELVTSSDPAVFNNSRNPLVGTFTFNGQNVTLVDVHSYSRGGSDPDFGAVQPATAHGDDRRTAMADAVADYVNAHAGQQFAVMGDFNGFYYEQALQDLASRANLVNLSVDKLAPAERYSYQYDGNLQEFDYILTSQGLAASAQYDSVHINSEFSAATRPTDHDPQVALLSIPRPNTAPHDLMLSHASVDENQPAGTVVGTLSASDTADDTLTYALTDNNGGRFAVDANTGVVTTTQALDYEAAHNYAITGTATDHGGLSTSANFTVAVGDVNEAPTATHDSVAVNEDATSGNLYATLLGNDSDPDAGTTLTITGVDTSTTLGSVNFDAATHTLYYNADDDSFDALATGQMTADHFSYTVSDGHGLTSTTSVEVIVTGVNDGVTLYAGNGKDALYGTAGEDTLYGGNGKDMLYGLDGNDVIYGGNGDDTLYGGNGADVLIGGKGNDALYGGAGHDTFHFGSAEGSDTIMDFDTSQDRIILDGGQYVKNHVIADVNHDGIMDLQLSLSGQTTVTLRGVSDYSQVKFGAPDAYSNHDAGAAPAMMVQDHLMLATMPLL